MTRSGRRRTRFGSAAGLLILLTTAVACNGASATPAGGGKVVFVAPGGTFGAAINAAFLAPFTKETGIVVEQVNGGDNPIAQTQAQVEAGKVQWDILGCIGSQALAFKELWEPLGDSIKVPSDIVNPGVVSDVYVASDVEVHPLLAYSTTKFKDKAPKNWADFFDTQNFPGPRGLSNLGIDSAWYTPAIALLADGVSADKLFPLDLDRAYAKLDKLKPNVRVFWTTFSQSQDIMRSGEVVMSVMTDGRALQLKYSGAPFDVSFQDGFERNAGRCIVKGSPNKANAIKFLQFMLDHPEQQGVLTSLSYYGPITQRGVEEAKKLGVTQFGSAFASSLIHETQAQYDYVLKNRDMLLNRWNAWVSK